MKQLVLVVSDLYFAAGAALSAAGEMRLPGLARMARFGAAEALPQGWRSWLAAWLGRPDLAAASPGAVAAAGAPSIGGRATATAEWVWLADPLHLTASLTSVHLSPYGLLRLDAPAQAELCRAFDEVFAEIGYRLAPTRSGRFLAAGPALPGDVETMDPARYLGSSIAAALPQGRAAAALRLLGAEIEMWLHEHPINALRARERRPAVSTLWLWGGGAPLAAEKRVTVEDPSPAGAGNPRAATVLFGDDPYVEGLSHLIGATCAPAPHGLEAVPAAAERTAVHLELFRPGDEPRSADGSSAAPLQAVEAFDRDWIAPALGLLARGELERLVVVANDRRVSLMRRDRWKRWRRPRAALAALQTERGPGRIEP